MRENIPDERHMIDGRPVSIETARAVVDKSVRHLIAILQRNGRFIYAHDAGDVTAVRDGYNMLRHCGTMWFLLRAVNESRIPLESQDCIKLTAGVSFAGRKFVAVPWAGGPQPRYGMVTKGMIKTGGIGLALVMLNEFRSLGDRMDIGSAQLPDELEKTIEGLEDYGTSQIHDGDFLHKRDLKDGTVSDFVSDYYTGEVLLGLFHSSRPQHAAAEVCHGLMSKDYGIAVQSHWMAYAACEAVERGLVERDFGLAYIRRLMGAIIEDPTYRTRRESTPIACRSEALTRTLLLDRRIQDALPPALSAEMLRTAEENMALQLQWYSGGQFWKGDTSKKVQIDYIQHNATAFLNWLALN